jgi:hypothetical protein
VPPLTPKMWTACSCKPFVSTSKAAAWCHKNSYGHKMCEYSYQAKQIWYTIIQFLSLDGRWHEGYTHYVEKNVHMKKTGAGSTPMSAIPKNNTRYHSSSLSQDEGFRSHVSTKLAISIYIYIKSDSVNTENIQCLTSCAAHTHHHNEFL